MPFFKSNELSLYYEVHGKGPKLLFIPGTASDLRQKLTIFKSPLRDHFEILSFDQRGIGQSNSPLPSPLMSDYANDIKHLLDHLGWKKCCCMGESFGGMVAQEFALSHPHYVEKLILAVTSSGGKGGSSFPYHNYDISKMTLEERADFWVQCADLRYQEAKWKETKLYKQLYETYLEVFQLGALNPERKSFSERQIAARKLHDTYERLPQLKMPIYIAAGKYDKTAPIENQLALLQKIPQARLSFFEGSHMMLWQDPFAFQSVLNFCSFG